MIGALKRDIKRNLGLSAYKRLIGRWEVCWCAGKKTLIGLNRRNSNTLTKILSQKHDKLELRDVKTTSPAKGAGKSGRD